jgi:hypothetical protein
MAQGVVLGVADVGGDVVEAVFVMMRTVVQSAVALGGDAQALAWCCDEGQSRGRGNCVLAGDVAGARRARISAALDRDVQP